MPVKPSVKSLTKSTVDILNAIRNDSSYSYQDRIPIATQENIKDIGKIITSYMPAQNEFLHNLVNRIGLTMVTSKAYKNPYAMFKRGFLEFGESVEEIFVNIAKAHEFNQELAETNVFKREIPDVNAVFHTLNSKLFYKTTVSNEELRNAFLSAEGVSDLIGRIVDSLYSGSEYDEFLTMKQMLINSYNNGALDVVTIPTPTAANAKQIVSTIKGVSNQIEFMSNKYNAFGVLTRTEKRDQILFINAAFDAVIDVEVLASAFNMDKAQFMGQRVLIDDFGGTNIVAALVDRDWFMVFDKEIGFTENYNGEGLYWNYWLHVWKIYSNSPYANAIAFTTDTAAVTGISVTPTTATVNKGQYLDLKATITPAFMPQSVTWSVAGTTDTVSSINNEGKLYVPLNETNTELTVTATSIYDTSKKATSTITVA